MKQDNIEINEPIVGEQIAEKKSLKLNYQQTIKVGFAFAIIMLFWTAYDFVVPLLLERAYGLSNAMRGLIMGLDNLLSLFMLPLFGKLSDRGKGKLAKKMGRRTPYIIVGTILSVALMVFVPLSAKAQLVRSEEIRAREFAAIMETDASQEAMYGMFYDEAKAGNAKYCDLRYIEQPLNNINTREKYVAIRYYPAPQEGELTAEQIESNSKYKKFVETGVTVYLSEKVNTTVLGTAEGKQSIAVYMIILFFVLIAMATFRSPAVALMPDVTPKPLRSQGNAIINLAGGAGAAIAFIVYTVALFFESDNIFIIIFATIGFAMLMVLLGFKSLVNEKKMVEEREIICKEYGIDDAEEEEKPVVKEIPNTAAEDEVEVIRKSKLEKAKFKSFLLILASIFMWFMGYNAVSST
ncbi:MAG: MFS transporter, partial [Clostridia bacterium]|nr:MFS transporter [Clostridia bacterium]